MRTRLEVCAANVKCSLLLVQVTNRDLSIAVLRCFLPILEREHAEGIFLQTAKQKRRQKWQRRQEAGVADGQQAAGDQQGPGQPDQDQDGEEPGAQGTEAQPVNAPAEAAAAGSRGAAGKHIRKVGHVLAGNAG